MKKTIPFADFPSLIGQTLEPTDWITITQEQVNQFAQATGDDQWIHLDIERAKAGPFGGTIAHGFLTLSLIPRFFDAAFEVVPAGMGVNYGLNKVRFTAPVHVGSRLRAHLKLLDCTPVAGNGMQMSWEVKIECEGQAKPVCVAESLVRRYP